MEEIKSIAKHLLHHIGWCSPREKDFAFKEGEF